MKNKLILSIAILLSHAAAILAHNGSINGQITEKGSGIELPGAVIKLTPSDAYTTTNSLGFFSFQNLAAGEYSLTITYLGFETKTVERVSVRNTETTTIRIELSPAPVSLKDVEITTAVSQPFQSISGLDIKTRPINSTQDVLRVVPGLFIAQHAGGGKAEQIFLRGFDIDHGTDINLSVDGMPVNMVSHAHGQGYADLHFVIPELIEKVAFEKGPYQADAGDFATAGVVRFKTFDALNNSMLKVEAGQFQTGRLVAAFNLLGENAARRKRHAYIASETMYSDGFFERPQGFHRLNLFGKFSALLDDEQKISISASAFQSSWDASGQIPERAVQSGQIGRFGAIDMTEGGETSRYNLNFEHIKSLNTNSLIQNQLYFSDYAFTLYSNFTFFKNDPVNGDAIRQKEHRRLFGYNGSYTRQSRLAGKKLDSEIGVFLRSDAAADTELSRVKQRQTLTARLALGDIRETSTGAYLSETWRLSQRFSVNAALRYDHFLFSYDDKLDSLYDRKQVSAGILSPKLNLHFDLSPAMRLYTSGGYGFHSNDARVVVPQNGLKILPKALGADLGAIFKPTPTLLFNAAAWYLALDQEFVYVGDEAVVEPGGRTARFGLDLSGRVQVYRALFADFDLTYAHVRSVDDPEGENYIPLAPRFTATGGLNWDKGKGFFGNLRFRQLADRPANEDGSIVATGYFLLDAMAGWKKKNLEISFSVQNLTNVAWKEAQFETESRLQFEAEPVTEIHYTPGSPFFLKGGISFRF
jgi:outer membrane receptor protein involved in Fe transport